jgi:hypothetical protein
MDGPYNVLLRSPEMGDLAQKFGAQIRFHSVLPKNLNDLAILMNAETIDTLATGQRPGWSPTKKLSIPFVMNYSTRTA